MLSPLRLGTHHELLRRYPSSPEPVEAVFVPPPPEPNFQVDDLLDFSNGELCDAEVTCDRGDEEAVKEANFSCNHRSIELKIESGIGESQASATSGLCVPSAELARQLEWLSAFNEDSSYSGDRQLASLVSSGCLGGLKDDEKPAPFHDKFQSPSPISVLEPGGLYYGNSYHHASLASTSCSQHVPSRARSKRARAGARVWSLDSRMPTLFDTRACGAAAQESPVFFGSRPDRHEPYVPFKKAKKPAILFKPLVETPPRRCSHCLVQKTPQWRAGPNGPKTLCNACGVRYKSGRLVPEYRPAGSPTFVSEVHSNSHKRILEMRRVKEMEDNLVEDKDEEEQEEEESDCLSQSESCKGDRMGDAPGHSCSSQDDIESSTCNERDDAAGSISSEKEDPSGSICEEKVEVCGIQLDVGAC